MFYGITTEVQRFTYTKPKLRVYKQAYIHIHMLYIALLIVVRGIS